MQSSALTSSLVSKLSCHGRGDLNRSPDFTHSLQRPWQLSVSGRVCYTSPLLSVSHAAVPGLAEASSCKTARLPLDALRLARQRDVVCACR